MKLLTMVVGVGLVLSFTMACPEEDKQCKAELKKCKIEHKEYYNNIFACVNDSTKLNDVDKCKEKVKEPKKCGRENYNAGK